MRPILLTLALVALAGFAQPDKVTPTPPAAFNFDDWVHKAKPLLPRDRGDECSNAEPHFAFNRSAQPSAHPFVCRQDGPHRGWYRQRIRGLHVSSPMCPDGSATCDMSLVRICQEPKIANVTAPCTGPQPPPSLTGANGCAICGTPTMTNHTP